MHFPRKYYIICIPVVQWHTLHHTVEKLWQLSWINAADIFKNDKIKARNLFLMFFEELVDFAVRNIII